MKTTIKKATKTSAVTKAVKAPAKKVSKSKSVNIVVTGATSKKVTTKKITGLEPKKELVIASNYNSFWMNDGQILDTLVALLGALKHMDKATYTYHTQANRHDFANWVEDVLADVDCAIALRKAKTAKSAHTVVLKYLALYK